MHARLHWSTPPGFQLQRALYADTLVFQARHSWPSGVSDIHGLSRPYLKHLSKLLVDEDFSPTSFAVCPARALSQCFVDRIVVVAPSAAARK